MSRKVELEIRDLLLEKQEMAQVADELLKRWRQFPYMDSEADKVACFLLNGKFIPSLLDHVTLQLRKKHKVIWAVYAEAIALTGHNIDQKVLAALIDGASEQGFMRELVQSPAFMALPNVPEEVSDLAQRLNEERQEERESRLEELFSKIEFLKSQRLYEQEKKVIERLVNFAPDDLEVARLHEDFQERWARYVVDRSTGNKVKVRAVEKWREKWRQEMQNPFQNVFESALMHAQTYPESAIDLAIMAHFMDFNEDALSLLAFAPNSYSKDWLQLELHLETCRFIHVLETCDQLERKYQNDPEANFAITLARAKAYWGLGKSNKAIDYLTSIQNVRPNYRSVSSLLQQWRDGVL